MDKLRAEIENLRAFLKEHERRYRLENAPTISDAEFDKQMERLKKLEAEHPEFADENSPTKKLGADNSEGFKKYPHLSKMLSLDNVFSYDELSDFNDRLKKVLKTDAELCYSIEPKIDGAGISAIYINGKLSRLITRGDGEFGDDITRNASVIKNLPQTLSGSNIPTLLEIRGEAFMRNSDFENIQKKQSEEIEKKLNAEFEGELSEENISEKKEALYANPRNLTSGTLKLLDKKILEQRKLYACFYAVGRLEGAELKKQSELVNFLKSLGLPSVQWQAKACGAKEVFEKISELEEKRKNFDYNTDGAVIKLDEIALHEIAGSTAKAPRWASAWKFKAERAEVIIYKITLQVGRTGAITPVAELEDARFKNSKKAVPLSGSKVSRATLHNFEEIRRRDIRVGDYALIEKAGEIIPSVVTILPAKREANSYAFQEPTHCPACGSKLVRNSTEAILRCINPECPEQVRRRLIHFASKSCMDIEGLGEAVVSELVELNLIKNFSDLYKLGESDLAKLSNFKEKSIENLLNSISKSKSVELWRLLAALGIPYVGERVAKDLANKFKNLDALKNANEAELASVNGVGEKIISSVISFFKSEENLKIIEKLREANLNFKLKEDNLRGTLSGKTFVLTGALSSMGRDEAKAKIEALGGKISSSVSKLTDFLISESESSAKLDKAKELGVKILSEAAFLEMLKTSNSGEEKTETSNLKKAEISKNSNQQEFDF